MPPKEPRKKSFRWGHRRTNSNPVKIEHRPATAKSELAIAAEAAKAAAAAAGPRPQKVQIPAPTKEEEVEGLTNLTMISAEEVGNLVGASPSQYSPMFLVVRCTLRRKEGGRSLIPNKYLKLTDSSLCRSCLSTYQATREVSYSNAALPKMMYEPNPGLPAVSVGGPLGKSVSESGHSIMSQSASRSPAGNSTDRKAAAKEIVMSPSASSLGGGIHRTLSDPGSLHKIIEAGTLQSQGILAYWKLEKELRQAQDSVCVPLIAP